MLPLRGTNILEQVLNDLDHQLELYYENLSAHSHIMIILKKVDSCAGVFSCMDVNNGLKLIILMQRLYVLC